MSSRPDIALFLPALEGGGAERVLLDLAAEFVRRDLRVDLVVAAWRGDLVSEVPPDVRQINLNTSRTLLALPGLTRYLRSASPKALLSTMGHANVVASFASWLAGGRSRTVLREAIH